MIDTNDEYPCGPESWKGQIPWLFRVHTPQFVFRDACRAHDMAYTVGGDERDRRTDDLMFYWSMLREIRQRRWWTRPWLRFWAYTYYRAVRHYGKAHFSYREHR